MEPTITQKFVGLDNYFKVATFLEAAEIPRGEMARPEEINIERSARLIVEEFGELQRALDKLRQRFDFPALIEVADALADLEYVINNMHHDLGLPAMEIFNAVHENNLTKLHKCSHCQGSGCAICNNRGCVIIKNAAGKVLKPEGYKSVNLAPILYAEYQRSIARCQGDSPTLPEEQQKSQE